MTAARGSEARRPTPVQLVRRQEKGQRYCNLCPRLCHHSCPVSNAERDEAVTPGHKHLTAGQVAGKATPLDEGTTDLFYKCANCRLCTTFCEHENDVSGSLLAARAMSVGAGFEGPAVADLRRSFEAHGNAWLEDLAARLRDIVPDDRRLRGQGSRSPGSGREAVVPGRGLRVYWPGCATVARRHELVSLTMAVCDALGEPDVSVYCGDEAQCCGYPLLAAGQHEAFVEHVKKASAALEGADVIFTGAPECAWTFSVAWPEHAGVAPPARRVAHIVDLLLPALNRAPARAPVELDAVYHDPCYLGRYLGRYEEPRKLVNSVLKEPMREAEPWVKEEAYCCGAGGELETTNPDTSFAITRARVGHLLGGTTGPPGEMEPGSMEGEGDAGRHIVTACPKCATRFREAGAPALDIVEVLGRYLGIASDEKGATFTAEDESE